ncbi:hypothetical protein AGMMS49938_10930 [Fibrobacterales bacterium]|nr:hypothetical protein AGMMS49938_10930 [Fibrobacterales bacterium]
MLKKASVCLLFCLCLSCESRETPSTLDVATVFAGQKAAAFPEMAEIHTRSTMSIPGIPAMQPTETTIISKGKDKSVVEIKSSVMHIKIVRNDGKVGGVDLKTGKTLPAQLLASANQGTPDLDKSFGAANDYLAPVKVDSLWRLSPKDPTHPTLYYSEKNKRIVKMTQSVSGTQSETTFRYCDASCAVPGTPSAIEMVSTANGQTTRILTEMTVKKRTDLSDAFFAVPK